jgi:hypothetical protein
MIKGKLSSYNLVVIVIAVVAFITVYSIAVKAATYSVISGYIILVDHAPTKDLSPQAYSTYIYLPSSNCQAYATSCSYKYPEGIEPKADINNDGTIDALDFYLLGKAYGCNSTQECWPQTFNVSECYFTFGDIRFKDPDGDCYINDTDIKIVSDCLSQTTSPLSASCDLQKCCKADMDKDGKVDIHDFFLVSRFYKAYADTYVNLGHVKLSSADINRDGDIAIMDFYYLARGFGASATEKSCSSVPLIHIDANRWELKVEGRGIYHIGCSYSCVPL